MTTMQTKENKLFSSKKNATGIAIVLSVAVLILIQGGFYNLPVGICGALISLFSCACSLKSSQRGRSVSAISALFMGLAIAYLASAIANGLTYTTLSEAGTWSGVAAVAILSSCQTLSQREQTLDWLAILGVATAILGMCAYCGILPIDGLMNLERLQFFFQYANAAGIWYVVVAILCLLSASGRLRACVPLPILALLLTQSGGAILVFVAFVVAHAARQWRAAEYEPMLMFGIQGIASMALFAAMTAIPEPVSSAIIVAAVVLCCLLRKVEPRFAKLKSPKRLAQALVVAVVVLAASALLLFSGRASDAADHFVDRLVYIYDGIRLWMTSPLLGVGPDNWQYLYPYMQSAQYHTSLVHSSYVQVANDAGIVGLGLLLAIVVLGLKALMGKESPSCDKAATIALAAIAIHSLIDFDLQFGSIAFLVAFLASTPRAPRLPAKNLLTGIACAALCVPMSIACVTAEVTKMSANLARMMGDCETTQSIYLDDPLAEEDVSIQTTYLQTANAAARYDLVETYYRAHGVASDEQAVYVAIALYNLGEPLEAGEVLIEHMERQPFNDEYLLSAKAVIDVFGLDDGLTSRYNAAVRAANDAVAALDPLIPEQRQLDIYL